jgi:hypothetical protein
MGLPIEVQKALEHEAGRLVLHGLVAVAQLQNCPICMENVSLFHVITQNQYALCV